MIIGTFGGKWEESNNCEGMLQFCFKIYKQNKTVQFNTTYIYFIIFMTEFGKNIIFSLKNFSAYRGRALLLGYGAQQKHPLEGQRSLQEFLSHSQSLSILF